MRQILFSIPVRDGIHLGPFGEVPFLGFGIALFAWLTFAAFSLWNIRRTHPNDPAEFRSGLVFCGLVAVAILVAPSVLPFERIPVFGYGAMLVCAVLFSGLTAAKRAPLAGASADFAWDSAVKVVLAGVIGARLFHLIQYREVAFRDCVVPLDFLKAAVMLPDGGLVLYGGIILAAATYFVMCRLRGVDPLKFGDAVVPAVFVGIAFGRLGCFLNGCCFGDVCHLPWAVTFPQDSVPWKALVDRGFLDPSATESLPLHPTQIYSTINAIVLAILTTVYYRFRKGDGSVVALALMTYPISRIFLEVLRNDERSQFGTGLTISQIVSLGVFGLGAALAWWSWTRSATEVTSPGSDSTKASAPA